MRSCISERVEITFGRFLLCYVLIAVACSGSKQGNQTTDSASEKEEIERTLTGLVDAANAGDLDAVMAYFAEDGVAMPSDEMPVFGTRLIKPRIQPLFGESRLVIFLTSEETRASGTMAFARGYISGRIESNDGAFTRYIEQNEYLMVLQKDSVGSWKIARLMWHPMELRQSEHSIR